MISKAFVGLEVAASLPKNDVFRQELNPVQPVPLENGVVIQSARCSRLLLSSLRCLSAVSLRPSSRSLVHVDLTELRENLGPSPLRTWRRLGFGCQRLDRFQYHLN